MFFGIFFFKVNHIDAIVFIITSNVFFHMLYLNVRQIQWKWFEKENNSTYVNGNLTEFLENYGALYKNCYLHLAPISPKLKHIESCGFWILIILLHRNKLKKFFFFGAVIFYDFFTTTCGNKNYKHK